MSLVLITSASILIDRILRHESTIDRLQCQIWLWLALAVTVEGPSQGNEEFDTKQVLFQTWLHVVIFCNILSIFAQWRNNSTAHSSLMLGRRKEHRLVDLLPISAWIATVTSILAMTVKVWNLSFHDATLWTLQVFVASLVIFWALQWHWYRKAELARQAAMIFGTHQMIQNNVPSQMIDQSHWYEWNVAETWVWITNILKTDDFDEEHAVLTLLARHRLHGNALGMLSLQQLVQILNIPYGPAVLLSQAIENLVQQHPKPQSSYDATHLPSSWEQSKADQSTANWLVSHDQEYNTGLSFYGSSAPVESDLFVLSNKRHPDVPTIDLDQEEQLARLMSDRYGLSLPSIRTISAIPSSTNLMDANPVEESIGTLPLQSSDPQRAYHLLHSQGAASVDTNVVDSPIDRPPSLDQPIPLSIFENMPPSIREIAQRRPDLVDRILTLKEQQNQSRNIAGEMQEDSDDEMTRLIQRKCRPQHTPASGNCL